ncbi:hypothetical protein BT93_L0574 [Corymbia citriodora subsp. variegata]|uniref:Methyltransferase domain-containing protein n=1 Tax=Corymbia citriodora subsp. variegata TaxID=360336 RepID=A0A8T0CJ03_CORYI|nr:hypothetical protein BT93_L0574 [Corymbia citriodora subsp. variegata]
MERFYQSTLTSIPNDTADLLEQYSQIPRSSQIEHILTLRNRAYQSHPYPCLGRFRFLELDLSSHPLYKSEILPRLLAESPQPLFLDLGTCLGQDLRKLVFDGVDPARLYGSDIVADFIDTGYEVFSDREKFPASHFLCPADIFSSDPSNILNSLDGRVTMLQASAVFHLFGLEQQRQVARRALRLLRRDCGQVLVIGGQAGAVEARAVMRSDGKERYRHDGDSWKAMWDEVCKEPEWKNVVKDVKVQTWLEERIVGQHGSDGAPGQEGGNEKRQSQEEEDGFRWMNFAVWLTF